MFIVSKDNQLCFSFFKLSWLSTELYGLTTDQFLDDFHDVTYCILPREYLE